MQAEDIKDRLQSHIENAQAEVVIEGSHVHVSVVSPAFTGLSAVKKQQMVYAVLSDEIASGAIHAVHMKTYTPEEAAQQ